MQDGGDALGAEVLFEARLELQVPQRRLAPPLQDLRPSAVKLTLDSGQKRHRGYAADEEAEGEAAHDRSQFDH